MHLGDHPAPVIGMGYGPSPLQYSMVQQQLQQQQQQQHMGPHGLRPGMVPAPGPGIAQRQGLMQGPGVMMQGQGQGPPPYGLPQGQVMGNMYMSQVPIRAGPYHQR